MPAAVATVPATTASAGVHDPGPTLREAIASELRARHLDEPDELARALGVLPFTAAGLLERADWAPETARFVINRLDLPIAAPAEPVRPSRPCLADIVGYRG